jgi:PAS domain S-box-containing protein
VTERAACATLGRMTLPPDAAGGPWGGAPSAAETLTQEYLERSPVPVLVAHASGRIIGANPAACALTGYAQAELVGIGIEQLGPPGGVVGHDVFAETIAQGHGSAELRLRRKDGSVCWVGAEGVRLGADRVAAFFRDVTARHEVAEALRRERALLEQIMDTSPVAIVTLDGTGRMTRVNRWAEEHLGARRSEIEGERYDDPKWRLTAPDGGPLPADALPFARVMGTGETLRDLHVGVEWPAGVHRQLAVTAAPLRDAGGTPTGLVCVLEDITERLAAECELRLSAERLRTLASEASLAEERERRRVATELHDRIAQPLAMAQLRLRALLPRVADPVVAGPIGEVCNLLDGALGDTRNLTFEISSPILYDLGFEAALEWLAEQLQARHGIACTFSDDGAAKPLAEDLRVVLYQGARELCTNVVKHAAARTARIAVRRVDERVEVEVSDDGVGFPAVAGRPLSSRGYGLFSLRERLQHLGARLEIDPRPGRGSRVTLIAPLAAVPPR